VVERRLINTSDLPLERAMLGAATAETTPPEVRHRALSALGLIGVAPLPSALATTTADTAARATGKARLWKAWFTKAALVISIGGPALAVGLSDTVPAPKHGGPAKAVVNSGSALAPAAAVPAPAAVAVRPEEEPPTTESTSPRAVNGPAKSGVAPAPSKSPKFSIREEIDLLDRARRRLADGDRAAARQLVDDYLSRFPNGELRDEAHVIRRDALRTQ
jgi:hypothetical protein